MRILVTGSRFWTQKDVIRQALAAAPAGSTVVHGAARGADRLADAVAKELGFTPEPYPADWTGLKKRAGSVRNQKMVDLGADVCLAFPGPESKGTWDCVKKARAAGIHTFVHPIPVDWPARIKKKTEQPTLPGLS